MPNDIKWDSDIDSDPSQSSSVFKDLFKRIQAQARSRMADQTTVTPTKSHHDSVIKPFKSEKSLAVERNTSYPSVKDPKSSGLEPGNPTSEGLERFEPRNSWSDSRKESCSFNAKKPKIIFVGTGKNRSIWKKFSSEVPSDSIETSSNSETAPQVGEGKIVNAGDSSRMDSQNSEKLTGNPSPAPSTSHYSSSRGIAPADNPTLQFINPTSQGGMHVQSCSSNSNEENSTHLPLCGIIPGETIETSPSLRGSDLPPEMPGFEDCFNAPARAVEKSHSPKVCGRYVVGPLLECLTHKSEGSPHVPGTILLPVDQHTNVSLREGCFDMNRNKTDEANPVSDTLSTQENSSELVVGRPQDDASEKSRNLDSTDETSAVNPLLKALSTQKDDSESLLGRLRNDASATSRNLDTPEETSSGNPLPNAQANNSESVVGRLRNNASATSRNLDNPEEIRSVNPLPNAQENDHGSVLDCLRDDGSDISINLDNPEETSSINPLPNAQANNSESLLGRLRNDASATSRNLDNPEETSSANPHSSAHEKNSESVVGCLRDDAFGISKNLEKPEETCVIKLISSVPSPQKNNSESVVGCLRDDASGISRNLDTPEETDRNQRDFTESSTKSASARLLNNDSDSLDTSKLPKTSENSCSLTVEPPVPTIETPNSLAATTRNFGMPPSAVKDKYKTLTVVSASTSKTLRSYPGCLIISSPSCTVLGKPVEVITANKHPKSTLKPGNDTSVCDNGNSVSRKDSDLAREIKSVLETTRAKRTQSIDAKKFHQQPRSSRDIRLAAKADMCLDTTAEVEMHKKQPQNSKICSNLSPMTDPACSLDSTLKGCDPKDIDTSDKSNDRDKGNPNSSPVLHKRMIKITQKSAQSYVMPRINARSLGSKVADNVPPIEVQDDSDDDVIFVSETKPDRAVSLEGSGQRAASKLGNDLIKVGNSAAPSTAKRLKLDLAGHSEKTAKIHNTRNACAMRFESRKHSTSKLAEDSTMFEKEKIQHPQPKVEDSKVTAIVSVSTKVKSKRKSIPIKYDFPSRNPRMRSELQLAVSELAEDNTMFEKEKIQQPQPKVEDSKVTTITTVSPKEKSRRKFIPIKCDIPSRKPHVLSELHTDFSELAEDSVMFEKEKNLQQQPKVEDSKVTTITAITTASTKIKSKRKSIPIKCDFSSKKPCIFLTQKQLRRLPPHILKPVLFERDSAMQSAESLTSGGKQEKASENESSCTKWKLSPVKTIMNVPDKFVKDGPGFPGANLTKISSVALVSDTSRGVMDTTIKESDYSTVTPKSKTGLESSSGSGQCGLRDVCNTNVSSKIHPVQVSSFGVEKDKGISSDKEPTGLCGIETDGDKAMKFFWNADVSSKISPVDASSSGPDKDISSDKEPADICGIETDDGKATGCVSNADSPFKICPVQMSSLGVEEDKGGISSDKEPADICGIERTDGKATCHVLNADVPSKISPVHVSSFGLDKDKCISSDKEPVGLCGIETGGSKAMSCVSNANVPSKIYTVHTSSLGVEKDKGRSSDKEPVGLCGIEADRGKAKSCASNADFPSKIHPVHASSLGVQKDKGINSDKEPAGMHICCIETDGSKAMSCVLNADVSSKISPADSSSIGMEKVEGIRSDEELANLCGRPIQAIGGKSKTDGISTATISSVIVSRKKPMEEVASGIADSNSTSDDTRTATMDGQLKNSNQTICIKERDQTNERPETTKNASPPSDQKSVILPPKVPVEKYKNSGTSPVSDLQHSAVKIGNPLVTCDKARKVSTSPTVVLTKLKDKDLRKDYSALTTVSNVQRQSKNRRKRRTTFTVRRRAKIHKIQNEELGGKTKVPTRATRECTISSENSSRVSSSQSLQKVIDTPVVNSRRARSRKSIQNIGLISINRPIPLAGVVKESAIDNISKTADKYFHYAPKLANITMSFDSRVTTCCFCHLPANHLLGLGDLFGPYRPLAEEVLARQDSVNEHLKGSSNGMMAPDDPAHAAVGSPQVTFDKDEGTCFLTARVEADHSTVDGNTVKDITQAVTRTSHRLRTLSTIDHVLQDSGNVSWQNKQKIVEGASGNPSLRIPGPRNECKLISCEAHKAVTPNSKDGELRPQNDVVLPNINAIVFLEPKIELPHTTATGGMISSSRSPRRTPVQRSPRNFTSNLSLKSLNSGRSRCRVSQPLSPVPEIRTQIEGDSTSVCISHKFNTGPLWTHGYCALWADGVYAIRGQLYGIWDAARTSSQIICFACNRPGATIVTFEDKMAHKIRRVPLKVYHYPCALCAKLKLNWETLTANR